MSFSVNELPINDSYLQEGAWSEKIHTELEKNPKITRLNLSQVTNLTHWQIANLIKRLEFDPKGKNDAGHTEYRLDISNWITQQREGAEGATKKLLTTFEETFKALPKIETEAGHTYIVCLCKTAGIEKAFQKLAISKESGKESSKKTEVDYKNYWKDLTKEEIQLHSLLEKYNRIWNKLPQSAQNAEKNKLIGDMLKEFVGDTAQVHKLALNNFHMTPEFFERVLAQFPKLQGINMHGVILGIRGEISWEMQLQCLLLLRKCQDLRVLNLGFIDFGHKSATKQVFQELFSSLKNLESVHFDASIIPDYLLETVTASVKDLSLNSSHTFYPNKELYGGQTRFPKGEKRKIYNDTFDFSKCTHLKTLDLTGTNIGLETMQTIPSGIQRLTLGSCKLLENSDLLALLERCTHLEELDISYCDRLDDRLLQKLPQSLKKLIAIGCKNFRDELLESFAKERSEHAPFELRLKYNHY